MGAENVRMDKSLTEKKKKFINLTLCFCVVFSGVTGVLQCFESIMCARNVMSKMDENNIMFLKDNE